MKNIGRSKVRIPEKISETAAHYFLDNAYRDIISEINQMWLVRSNNNIYEPKSAFVPAVSQHPVTEHDGKPLSTGMNMNLFN